MTSLNNLRVSCLHEDCNEAVRIIEFEQHMKECIFKLLECELCGSCYHKIDEGEHQLICEMGEVECGRCNSTTTRRDLPNHDCVKVLKQKLASSKDEIRTLKRKLQQEKRKNEEENKENDAPSYLGVQGLCRQCRRIELGDQSSFCVYRPANLPVRLPHLNNRDSFYASRSAFATSYARNWREDYE